MLPILEGLINNKDIAPKISKIPSNNFTKIPILNPL
jgi:hypothetical protein